MQIAIHGRNVNLPKGTRTAVEEKVARLDRLMEGIERADILFREERNPRITEREVCEATVVRHGRVVRARAVAADSLVATDRVVDKLEHRLEKLKGRLVGRSHPRHGARRVQAEDRELDGREVGEDADEEADGSPSIIRTRQRSPKPMTAEEAALQLDHRPQAFIFFTDAETGRPAVVYHREDGRIGLIDSD